MIFDDRQHPMRVANVGLVDDPDLVARGHTIRLDQCDGVDCDCGASRLAFHLSPYHWRRLYWRNLSPVVQRLSSGGVTIARHADGRFTLEASP